jgi:predicted MFS family arabinose efflux permease
MKPAVLQGPSAPAAAPYRWTAPTVARLAVLGLAAYVYVLAEMTPIGATPAIAADLGVSEAHVGILTAAYAFVTVLSTLPLVRLTQRWPRRRVLVMALSCLTVSQLLSMLAPDLATLAASRVLCALTHGLMWAVVMPIAARLVPPTHTARATTAVYAGTTAALIVGNPLTTAMSEAWGWRPAVAVLTVAAAATTLLAQSILPRMAADTAAIGTAAPPRPSPYRNNRLVTLCALTFVGVTAHFVSFTFIVPLIRDVVGAGGPDESWVYAGYGVVGLLAMATVAPALDRRMRPAAAGAAAILCLAFWCLSGLAGGSGVLPVALGITAIMVWGASTALLPPLLQSAAIRTCPEQPERASALYVTTFQVGIVAGSLAGGVVYAHSGIAAVVAASSVLFAVALAGVLFRGDAFEPDAADHGGGNGDVLATGRR